MHTQRRVECHVGWCLISWLSFSSPMSHFSVRSDGLWIVRLCASGVDNLPGRMINLWYYSSVQANCFFFVRIDFLFCILITWQYMSFAISISNFIHFSGYEKTSRKCVELKSNCMRWLNRRRHILLSVLSYLYVTFFNHKSFICVNEWDSNCDLSAIIWSNTVSHLIYLTNLYLFGVDVNELRKCSHILM